MFILLSILTAGALINPLMSGMPRDFSRHGSFGAFGNIFVKFFAFYAGYFFGCLGSISKLRAASRRVADLC
jgi:hypothetical protein